MPSMMPENCLCPYSQTLFVRETQELLQIMPAEYKCQQDINRMGYKHTTMPTAVACAIAVSVIIFIELGMTSIEDFVTLAEPNLPKLLTIVVITNIPASSAFGVRHAELRYERR